MPHFGKFLSLALRHNPKAARVTLDKNGWCNVEALLLGCQSAGFTKTKEDLEHEVTTNPKQRFEFNEDKTLIRACQGHSLPIDAEAKKTSPPETLYHGTTAQAFEKIRTEGLQPMQRNHVHLSGDRETATKVGRRHGQPLILIVHAKEMEQKGHTFYLSSNKVWLTEHVPVEFLSLRAEEIPQDLTV